MTDYITIADVRAEGLDATEYPDAEVQAAIETWQAFLIRACRQWFEPIDLTLEVDGTNSDTIHTGVPIISIEYVKLNGDSANLDTDYYKVYNSRSYPDDRRNPRIKLVMADEEGSIYTRPWAYGRGGRMIFRKGRKNQTIKGVFGFTEPDGSVPKLIQRALLKLVIEKLTTPLYTAAGSPPPGGSVPPLLGPIIEERTDGHQRKFGQAGGELKPRAPGLSGITSDQEILDIIRLYKAPIGCATPANPSYS